jgi:hypothetical protein
MPHTAVVTLAPRTIETFRKFSSAASITVSPAILTTPLVTAICKAALSYAIVCQSQIAMYSRTQICSRCPQSHLKMELTDLYIRLRSLFRRRSVENKLHDDLRFHLDQQLEKHQRAGLSPEEARRQARLEFGGFDQIKEDCRQARGVAFLEAAAQDLRYALSLEDAAASRIACERLRPTVSI